LQRWKDYGGNTEKPTWLYCNYDILDDIDNYRTSPGPEYGKTCLVTHYRDSAGAKKFCGNKNLKGSQEYTEGFARAVKKLITKNEMKVRRHREALRQASRHTRESMHKDPELWRDADVASIMNYLTTANYNWATSGA